MKMLARSRTYNARRLDVCPQRTGRGMRSRMKRRPWVPLLVLRRLGHLHNYLRPLYTLRM